MQRQPARKIKPSAVKNIFKFPSTKSFVTLSRWNYQMVLVESMLEKDFCFHLEANSDVLHYYPQPKSFEVNSELLKNRKYTPDFEVHFHDGRKAYVEIKKNFDSLDELYLHKLERAADEMRQTGHEFLFVDESQIRIQPLLDNLRKLQRFRSRLTNNTEALMLLKKSVPKPHTLNDLIENQLGIRPEIIYQLIANGFIWSDLLHDHLSLDVEVRYA